MVSKQIRSKPGTVTPADLARIAPKPLAIRQLEKLADTYRLGRV